MKKLNVAVVGVGHLGSRHLKVLCRDLADKVSVVGVCDCSEEKARQAAQEFQVPCFTDYRRLKGLADAVNICTPTTTHHEIARFFLREQTHTFVEKPISLTCPEADELIALSRTNSVKLQVGHIERFNSAFQAIVKFAKNPRFIECHRLNRFPNRSLDIGVVMDLMIHDIDIILGLISAPIEDIHAVGVNVLTDREDIANCRITFADGCVCNLTASRVSDEVTRKIRIFLPDQYISLDYVKQEAFVYKKADQRILKHALPIEKEEPLKKELEAFVDCIVNNSEPIVSGQDGRRALKLALDIGQQIWESQKKKF